MHGRVLAREGRKGREGTGAGVLLVMAKAPEPGKVKTRLVPALGERRAAALAEAFLVDTWSRFAPLPDIRPVLVLAGGAPPRLRPVPEIWPQGAGDLGARLEGAMRRALQEAPWALAVGTDSPDLPLEYVGSALELLRTTADAVLGPTEDGGYYLIGLRRCPAGLLTELPWSSPGTYVATAARLSERGLKPVALPTWYDVDEPEDVERLRRQLDSADIVAPETRRALAARLQ